MLRKALKTAKEWQASLPPKTQVSVSKKDRISSTSLNVLAQCPGNVDLLFSDAACNGTTLAGGLSCICTDASGVKRFQGTGYRHYIASALAAEALAMKAGLSKAVLAGIKDVICVSDSKSLVELITGNKSVVAIRGILHDISVLSLSFNSISYKFISRDCNVAADSLAKHALFQNSNNLSEIDHSVVV